MVKRLQSVSSCPIYGQAAIPKETKGVTSKRNRSLKDKRIKDQKGRQLYSAAFIQIPLFIHFHSDNETT